MHFESKQGFSGLQTSVLRHCGTVAAARAMGVNRFGRGSGAGNFYGSRGRPG